VLRLALHRWSITHYIKHGYQRHTLGGIRHFDLWQAPQFRIDGLLPQTETR